jgi:hypothetical protein
MARSIGHNNSQKPSMQQQRMERSRRGIWYQRLCTPADLVCATRLGLFEHPCDGSLAYARHQDTVPQIELNFISIVRGAVELNAR